MCSGGVWEEGSPASTLLRGFLNPTTEYPKYYHAALNACRVACGLIPAACEVATLLVTVYGLLETDLCICAS